jgi:hypothetical protein
MKLSIKDGDIKKAIWCKQALGKYNNLPNIYFGESEDIIYTLGKLDDEISTIQPTVLAKMQASNGQFEWAYGMPGNSDTKFFDIQTLKNTNHSVIFLANDIQNYARVLLPDGKAAHFTLI